MMLDISQASLWTICPAAGAYCTAVCRVGSGEWLCDLEWAGHPEVQYPVKASYENGVLRVQDPGDATVAVIHVLGALKHVDQDTFDGVILVNASGHTQFNLNTLADSRDVLTDQIEEALRDPGVMLYTPAPKLCAGCPGAIFCSEFMPPEDDFLR